MMTLQDNPPTKRKNQFAQQDLILGISKGKLHEPLRIKKIDENSKCYIIQL